MHLTSKKEVCWLTTADVTRLYPVLAISIGSRICPRIKILINFKAPYSFFCRFCESWEYDGFNLGSTWGWYFPCFLHKFATVWHPQSGVPLSCSTGENDPAHQYFFNVCQNFLKPLSVCVLKVILNMKCSNSNTLCEKQRIVMVLFVIFPVKEPCAFTLQARRNCCDEIGLSKCPCPCHSDLRDNSDLTRRMWLWMEHAAQNYQKLQRHSATIILDTKLPQE